METNKLEQLTRRLFEEGLEKGRSEGERLVADAEAQARKTIAEAEGRAQEIARKAHAEAEELRGNTMTEIALAGREAVARIREEIASLIVARSIEGGVRQAGIDPGFVKEILLAAAKGWGGSGSGSGSGTGTASGRVALQALLPESRRRELDAAFEKSAAELLAAGVEVGYSPDVRTGFRVGEKGGRYYLGFSDESFQALLGQYLREKAFDILYGEK